MGTPKILIAERAMDRNAIANQTNHVVLAKQAQAPNATQMNITRKTVARMGIRKLLQPWCLTVRNDRTDHITRTTRIKIKTKSVKLHALTVSVTLVSQGTTVHASTQELTQANHVCVSQI